MLLPIVFSSLAAVSLASSTTTEGRARLAAVTDSGRVLTSMDGGHSWRDVHACPTMPNDTSMATPDVRSTCIERPRSVVIAWVEHTLYLSCTGESLWQWNEAQGTAQPVKQSVENEIVALAAHNRTLFIADGRADIWSLEPAHQSFIHVAVAPEPVTSMAVHDGALILAGPTAVWRNMREPANFTVLAPIAGCALVSVEAMDERPSSLWLAGPVGLVQIDENFVRTRWTSPLTAVTHWQNSLLLGDGSRVLQFSLLESPPPPGRPDSANIPAMSDERLVTHARPSSSPSPVRALMIPTESPRPLDPETRARWMSLFPKVEMTFTLRRSPSQIAFDVWVSLTWFTGRSPWS